MTRAGFAVSGKWVSVSRRVGNAVTRNRVRHIPVLENGQLAGIVSIGDVVKRRMEELEAEQEQLQAYITRG